MNTRTSCALALALVGGLAGIAHAQCGRRWVQLDLPVSPSPRLEGFAMRIADPQFNIDGVFFGGLGPNGQLQDTWHWRTLGTSGSYWEPVQTAGLVMPRLSNGAALSPVRLVQAPVIAGGLTTSGNSFVPQSSVYVYNVGNSEWVPSSPMDAPRWNHAGSFGGALTNRALVYGGVSSFDSAAPLLRTVRSIPTGFVSLNAIDPQGSWVLSGVPYTEIDVAFPFGDRRATLGAAPEISGQILLVTVPASGPAGVTSVSWPMAPRANYAIAARAELGLNFSEVVMFGGDLSTFPTATGLFGDTWVSNTTNGAFSQVPGPGPSPRRARNQMFYDSRSDWFVLFGGHNGSFLNDTWVLTSKPVIQQRERVIEICPGQDVTLSVGALWPDTLTYQWGLNGQTISPLSNPSAATGTLQLAGFVPPAGQIAVVECTVTTACGSFNTQLITLVANLAVCTGCDSIDFNGDSLFPDDNDLVDFLRVLAGGECSTNTCNDIDFNNDGLFPDDNDLVVFLRVLAGGECAD